MNNSNMRKTIIMISIAIAIVSLATSQVTVAQEISADKARRELKKEKDAAKKDLYGKTDRIVKKESRRLSKEGWKSIDLPLEYQLKNTWESIAQKDENGYSKYIYKSSIAFGQNYSAAIRQAENVAKLGIASDMSTLIQSMAELAIGNSEQSRNKAASIGQSVEKAKLIVNGKLGRVVTSSTLYRETAEGYQVRVTVLYNQKAALEAASQAARETLKDEMGLNEKDFDVYFGYEALREKYESGVWDEVIE